MRGRTAGVGAVAAWAARVASAPAALSRAVVELLLELAVPWCAVLWCAGVCRVPLCGVPGVGWVPGVPCGWWSMGVALCVVALCMGGVCIGGLWARPAL